MCASIKAKQASRLNMLSEIFFAEKKTCTVDLFAFNVRKFFLAENKNQNSETSLLLTTNNKPWLPEPLAQKNIKYGKNYTENDNFILLLQV